MHALIGLSLILTLLASATAWYRFWGYVLSCVGVSVDQIVEIGDSIAALPLPSQLLLRTNSAELAVGRPENAFDPLFC